MGSVHDCLVRGHQKVIGHYQFLLRSTQLSASERKRIESLGKGGGRTWEAHRICVGLELEITEAILIRDDDKALAILHELRTIGTRIALDDFGTGYSSLSYLQRFPFDKSRSIAVSSMTSTNPKGHLLLSKLWSTSRRRAI